MKKALVIFVALAACWVGQTKVRAAEPAPFSVVVTGSGPPMILIPGLASGGNVWDGTVAHFKNRYQCHVLTLAGFAGQPPLEGPFLQKVRDGIIDYLRQHKLIRPIIVGHSLGGMMAFWVAETAPTEVGPIISVDGVPFYSALVNPEETSQSMVPRAEQMRSKYGSLPQEQFVANNHLFLSAVITSSANVDKVASLGAKSDPKAVGQAFYDLITTDLRPKLKDIQSPVLLIGSFNDATNRALKAQSERAYSGQIAAVPHHKLVFAPTARHFIQLDDPDYFYGEAESFLKANKK